MLKRIVLDVLKPEKPEITTFSEKLSDLEGVDGVNVSLYEIDKEVENVKVTLEGELEFDAVKDKINGLGASIHSVDEVSAGGKLIREGKGNDGPAH